MSQAVIGVDLGGTQLRVARFDPALHLEERHATPTLAEEGREAVIARLLEAIAAFVPARPTELLGIGVSVPSPVNPYEGIVVKPPNLPGWHHVPLRAILQERFDCPVYVGNDANVAALAEATQGAAQGYRYVVYLTISTGIGAGIINDGRLLVGARGLGAEGGHIMMVVDGEILDLEGVASGTAIARQARARLRAGASSRILDLAGRISAVTARHVGEAAQQGDPLAVELIHNAGRMVGLGIVSLMHILNPEIFVIGGGVSQAGELLFAPMREAVRAYVLDAAYYEGVPIVPAALGDNVALIGAAALVTTYGGSQVAHSASLT